MTLLTLFIICYICAGILMGLFIGSEFYEPAWLTIILGIVWPLPFAVGVIASCVAAIRSVIENVQEKRRRTC